MRALCPDGVYAEFARPYFECARVDAPEAMTMLRSLLPPAHLPFGSDYSYLHFAHPVGLFGRLELPEATRQMIERGNAAALLPRWNT